MAQFVGVYGWDESVAKRTEACLTYTLSFAVNSLITWRDRKATPKELGKRMVKFALIMIFLGMLSVWVFDWATSKGLHFQLSNLIAVASVTGIKFFVLNGVVFIKRMIG